MSSFSHDSFSGFSFLQAKEGQNQEFRMTRTYSDWSSSTEPSISSLINLSASPNVDQTTNDPIQIQDDEDILFRSWNNLEYVPMSNLEAFQGNIDQDFDQRENMLKQSKKIRKEKVQLETSQKSYSPASPSMKQKTYGRKDNWKPEEDAQLLALYAELGPRWSKIASHMKNRTGKQIRDRYTNNLRPDINSRDWTPEEEELLFSLCEKFGKKWSKIASHLPGRTENQVKNKFYWEQRKEKALLVDKPKKSPKASKSQGKEEKFKILDESGFEAISEPANFNNMTSPNIDDFFGNERGTYFLERDQTFSDSFREVHWKTL